jgi:hypothetical protein
MPKSTLWKIETQMRFVDEKRALWYNIVVSKKRESKTVLYIS